MYDYYIEVSTCERTFFMHIGAVILKCSQTGEILVSKIRDLYREDMQPFIDLTKGAELLYEVQKGQSCFMKYSLYPFKVIIIFA